MEPHHAECHGGHDAVKGAVHPLRLRPAALRGIPARVVRGRVHARVAPLGRQPVAGLALVRIHDAGGPMLRLDQLHEVLRKQSARPGWSLFEGIGMIVGMHAS